jgi:ferredoxin--NADP+ reductase
MTAEQTQGHPTTEQALAQLLFAQNAAIGSRRGSAMNRVSSSPQMIKWGNPEPAWKSDPGFQSAGQAIGDSFAEKSFAPQWGAKGSATVTAPTSGEEDFLEFSPYYDQKEMPDNTYRPKAPFEGKIISVKRIVGPKATGETCDVIIEHGGDMPYIEGQSYGVIAPGVSPKTGKPNKVRLYSIASSRYGDDQTGKTTTLCVRRATYWCPELKADDPAKKGVCSNFLCDAEPGTVVKMTGPSGKVMLLPEDKPETDIIMVATGTGILHGRSWRRSFINT